MAGAQGTAADQVRETVLGTRCSANAACPCPRHHGRAPALRGSLGRSSSWRAGEEPCRSSRAARSSCSLVGPAAAISGHGGSISGGHQGSYVRLIHSPIYATSFRCSVLLIASVLQFTAKLRTTSDCCCFMPLVTTEPEEQILKSSNHNQCCLVGALGVCGIYHHYHLWMLPQSLFMLSHYFCCKFKVWNLNK